MFDLGTSQGISVAVSLSNVLECKFFRESLFDLAVSVCFLMGFEHTCISVDVSEHPHLCLQWRD